MGRLRRCATLMYVSSALRTPGCDPGRACLSPWISTLSCDRRHMPTSRPRGSTTGKPLCDVSVSKLSTLERRSVSATHDTGDAIRSLAVSNANFAVVRREVGDVIVSVEVHVIHAVLLQPRRHRVADHDGDDDAKDEGDPAGPLDHDDDERYGRSEHASEHRRRAR